jgi:hypothetical protein
LPATVRAFVCLDLQADAVRPSAPDDNEIAHCRRLLDQARTMGLVLVHLRTEGEGGSSAVAELAEAAGERVFTRTAVTPAFQANGFRAYLNQINPASIAVLSATHGHQELELGLALANVGFETELLAEAIVPPSRALDPGLLARQTTVQHPRLHIALKRRDAVPAGEKKTANSNVI